MKLIAHGPPAPEGTYGVYLIEYNEGGIPHVVGFLSFGLSENMACELCDNVIKSDISITTAFRQNTIAVKCGIARVWRHNLKTCSYEIISDYELV